MFVCYSVLVIVVYHTYMLFLPYRLHVYGRGFASPFPLIAQIIPNSALQLPAPFAQHTRQILQIITSSQSKPSDEILSGSLQITIITSTFGDVVFRTTEVGVRADGGCAFEAGESGLGFLLRGRVVGGTAEEFI